MIGDILQPTHLLLILVVALLVLGPKRLPEVGRSLGRGLRDFRGALSGDDSQDEMVIHPAPRTVDPAPEPPSEPTVDAAPPTVDVAPETSSEPAAEPVEHLG